MGKGKITGIGGVFFKCNNPEALRNWYSDVLGLQVNDYGVLFEIQPFAGTPKYLQLGTFEASTNYFKPSEKSFMLNFRVDDLEAYLKQLGEHGVMPLGEVESYPYGKFAHVMDPEGNKIELWEPNDSCFEEDNGDTTPFI
jgi:predicted enzyme related to lactoylglutathione lyase